MSCNRPQILFVDDEQAVLEALSARLAGLEKRLDLHFVRDAEAALEALENNAVDVIVSDMHMPGMNGASLLTAVRLNYPRVVRIVLSDRPEDELTLESLHATHRFLTKPVTRESLESALDVSLTLRETLRNEALVKAMSDVDSVPALPAIYDELMAELASEHGTVINMGRIIERDMGLSATILKIVNSAFYGLFRRVESPAQAATLLGADVVKNLAMSEKLFSQFSADEINLARLAELNSLANVTGLLAFRFAKLARLGRRQSDHCQVAGLLGRLGDLLAESRLKTQPSVMDGTLSPALIGGYVLDLWALPDAVVDAVTHQHVQPGKQVKEISPTIVLHSIRHLQHQLTGNELPEPQQVEILNDYLAGLVPRELADAWLQVYLEWFTQEYTQAA